MIVLTAASCVGEIRLCQKEVKISPCRGASERLIRISPAGDVRASRRPCEAMPSSAPFCRLCAADPENSPRWGRSCIPCRPFSCKVSARTRSVPLRKRQGIGRVFAKRTRFLPRVSKARNRINEPPPPDRRGTLSNIRATPEWGQGDPPDARAFFIEDFPTRRRFFYDRVFFFCTLGKFGNLRSFPAGKPNAPGFSARFSEKRGKPQNDQQSGEEE
jgi:hypothetical protein